MKWILTNCIRIDFDYSRLVRTKSAILIKMGEECGMHGSEGNIEQMFYCKMGRKESIQKACVDIGG